MGRTLLCSEKVCPGLALGVWQTPPDKMVDFVCDNFDKVWSVREKIGIENDFAASEKARREDFVTRAGTRFKLAPMCSELALETDC